MVLMAAEITTFFRDNKHMGIPHATVIQLQTVGITTIGDLVDCEKDSVQQLADNLHCPGGRIPNDMLIDRNTEAVDEAIQVLQQSFELKKPTMLEDYLGVQVIKSKNGEKGSLGQPTIIKSLEKTFAEDVQTLQSTLTSGSPAFVGQKFLMRKIR